MGCAACCFAAVTNILEDNVPTGPGAAALQPAYAALVALCQQRLLQLFGGEVQVRLRNACMRE